MTHDLRLPMRDLKTFIVDITRKPPMLLPLVALFHVLWLVYIIVSDIGEPFPSLLWLEPVWMTAYTICWLAACDLSRWGAVGYILLAVFNSLLYLGARNGIIADDYRSNMLIVDLLLSVFLLYYYKRFNR